MTIATATSWGALNNYNFSYGSAQPTNMGSAVTLRQNFGGYNRVAGGQYFVNIGFNFLFDGTSYSTIGIATNGAASLGTTIPSPTSNNLGGASVPILAPLWGYFYMTGGAGGCSQPRLSYLLSGSAPNRVFIVQWKDLEMAQYRDGSWGTFELRIYETSNKIEFFYERVSVCDVCGRGRGCGTTSASIGIAKPGSFQSVSLSGTPSSSTSTANNSINLASTGISNGTLLTFTPCDIILAGLLGPGFGGTSTMQNGDQFFSGFLTQTGQQAIYKPMRVLMTGTSCTGSYTMSITGANATDYFFNNTPGTQVVTRASNSAPADSPAITFKPTGTGVRTATLTMTSPTGFSRTFTLSAGAPLVNYTGIIPQGGTTLMASGDTLLNGFPVDRFTSQAFTPFMLTNVSPASQTVTYTITDPTGQYSISGGTTIAAGASTTPTITFAPTGFSYQRATLLVTAAGQSRTFILNAISAAPGGDLLANIAGTTNTFLIDSNALLFVNTTSCTGEQANVLTVTMRNTGYHDFSITGADFFQTDTTYGQGRPRYPYRRDAQNNLIRMADYVITAVPPVLPYKPSQQVFPISVPQGQSRTIYISFIAQRAEKRFARAFIYTNGQSRSNLNVNGVLTEGVLTFDVFGRGVSPTLSDNIVGGLPKAVVFPETKIGDSSDAVLHLFNPGVCPLRISLPRMNITSGDVDEFSVVSIPTSGIDAATGDVVLQPGVNDSVRLRFKPVQYGSRRAGLRLMTNDSTIVIQDITERGVYYLDLYGTGKADLYAEDVDFGGALIGGTGVDLVHKIVRLKNTLSKPVSITKVTIAGVDAGEFTQDGGTPWPTLPVTINAGQELNLSVVFGPVATGQPGARNGVVKIALSNGDTVVAHLKGVAGTRALAANPSVLNISVSPGKVTRKTVTVTNTGTMPLTITKVKVTQIGTDFTMGPLARMVLDPGQTEYLEITYAPQVSGTSSASLDISSNGTNGTVSVPLQGVSKTKRLDIDPSLAALRNGDPVGTGVASPVENLSTSGIDAEAASFGMALRQTVPNPAFDQVEIGYWLANSGEISLELYDGAGRLVKVLDAGMRYAGEQHLRVDVSGLASGLYHYRLTSGGHSISRTMTVAR